MIVIDRLRSYPAAKAEIPELTKVKQVFVKAAARINNRTEKSHQPTRERECRMRGFATRNAREIAHLLRVDPATFRTQATLLCASLYRKQLAARFDAWREFYFAQDPASAF